MATKRTSRPRRAAPATIPPASTLATGGISQPGANAAPAGMTGRYIVVFKNNETAVRAASQLFKSNGGMTVAMSSDFSAASAGSMASANAQVKLLEHAGAAIVDAPPDQMQFVAASTDDNGPFLAIEPEEYVYACNHPIFGVGSPTALAAPPPGMGLPTEYLRGYRDAVNHLVGYLLGESLSTGTAQEIGAALDETSHTYGLQLCNVTQSRFTGKGIKVAVLDTGFDLTHPDFIGRTIVSKSFVPGEEVQDVHGHGTHCAGTACGPKRASQLPRYGVACESDLFVGKVLNDQGMGVGGSVLEGIDWAIQQGCHVISMSLSAPVAPGANHFLRYEMAARRGLNLGCLLIAAAGNDSNRPFDIRPVGSPANCPSILSVGGVDARLQMYVRSNGGINQQGGKVDIAGPGVDVRSAYPQAKGSYTKLSGTSMAAPHVAGVAALLAEAVPTARGMGLWALLLQKTKALGHPSRDVGAGLVQAIP